MCIAPHLSTLLLNCHRTLMRAFWEKRNDSLCHICHQDTREYNFEMEYVHGVRGGSDHGSVTGLAMRNSLGVIFCVFLNDGQA